MTYSAIALSAAASFATADITVAFQEGAPKDRFVITSESCAIADVTLAINLASSNGKLIFDVTADGAGVEVFQPVEVQAGTAQTTPVVDGDQMFSLSIGTLQAGAPVVISADLDDVLANSALGQIRVAGSELDGATVTLSMAGKTLEETFQDGTNRVAFPNACVS